jgi:hypothetical protein
VAVALNRRQDLEALSYGDCQLSVAELSGIAQDYFVAAWSSPLTGNCARLPGERLMVTPHYRASGYRVPQTAVMQWQGASAVLVKRSAGLEPVAVEILANIGQDYFVSCSEDLATEPVLNGSVSAVQGLLSGLGGE